MNWAGRFFVEGNIRRISSLYFKVESVHANEGKILSGGSNYNGFLYFYGTLFLILFQIYYEKILSIAR